MSEQCDSFNPNLFTPNICCNCFRDKQYHQNSASSNEYISSAVQIPADHETTDNNDQYNQNETATTSEPILVQTSFPTTLPQCKYGVACYETDGSHFEQFLHPPSHRRHHTSNTSSSRVNSSSKIDQHRTNEQDMVPSNEISTMKTLPPCKYGLSCYRTNPNHFEHYSHPLGHIRQEQFSNIGDVDIPIVSNDSPSPMVPTCRPDNERKLKLKEKLKEQKKSELHFIELMQNKVESLIDQLELKDKEITKLRQDLTEMVTYSQELEMALAEEINHRERRELERKQIVAIPRQTPRYWGPNAFEEPYREIEISTQSPEFDIINQLMNATISNHGNKYGTINGQDPTEFLINRIIRIHNNELWHTYCYKKPNICRNCGRHEQYHQNSASSNEHMSCAIEMPADHEITDNNDQYNQNETATNSEPILVQTLLPTILPQCRHEATKLRQDLTKMVKYNQQLEMALGEEIDHRERRELERKQIVAIPRQTPGYWGPNAFEEPYREIEISTQSPEFDIINQLMNATISNHGSKYGTINGQDPTELLINRIIRIHNNELWHVYCYKKDMIIHKYNDRLTDCESSKYLQAHPILTPLLDTKTNEYWLFHGCSRNSLYHLLHSGYDPRVSNLSGMFGGGFYLAENSSKSNRYIPCPKCGKNSIGNDIGCNCANQQDIEFAIVLYRAALGDVHVAMNQNSLDHLLHSGYDPRVSNLCGMFGGGFYLAENSSKSNQYIPCPRCGKNSIDNDIGCNCANQQDIEFAIVLYRAALGDVHVAMKYDKEKYRRGPNGQRVRRPPKKTNDKDLYDSVMGESMENGSDRLKYREFILYDSGQAYPEYVIYFRRSANRARQSSNIENLKKKCRNFLINTFRKNPE
ncbi:unnamed protein product [Rotaria sordida]|uniref:Poly [ADP-ribose] polymerase n=1 Tax=Rotaria sordida TaxID=392033 RepID=A0A814NZL6_9BILA|nr:unnamed protein product [Rotaria sordida]